MKVNPLADWSANADVMAEIQTVSVCHRHELVSRNYLSIGCMPCTSPVRPGEKMLALAAGAGQGQGRVRHPHRLPRTPGDGHLMAFYSNGRLADDPWAGPRNPDHGARLAGASQPKRSLPDSACACKLEPGISTVEADRCSTSARHLARSRSRSRSLPTAVATRWGGCCARRLGYTRARCAPWATFCSTRCS